jgi:hypothetical protein
MSFHAVSDGRSATGSTPVNTQGIPAKRTGVYMSATYLRVSGGVAPVFLGGGSAPVFSNGVFVGSGQSSAAIRIGMRTRF